MIIVSLYMVVNKVKKMLNINESIEWLNDHSNTTWSRTKFWRLRKRNFFKGSFRKDTNSYYFSELNLKRGCKSLGLEVK